MQKPAFDQKVVGLTTTIPVEIVSLRAVVRGKLALFCMPFAEVEVLVTVQIVGELGNAGGNVQWLSGETVMFGVSGDSVSDGVHSGEKRCARRSAD